MSWRLVRARRAATRAPAVGLLVGTLLTGALVAPAMAAPGSLVAPAMAAPNGGDFGPGPSDPPQDTGETQRDTVRPRPGGSSGTAPADTCSVYASSSGFGMLCSTSGAGQTLATQASLAGIDLGKAFCWDDPDLPDGFDPSGQGAQPPGPGRWWLYTCLSFDGAIVKDNARVSYEYRYRRDGEERRLSAPEQAFVTRVLGRGQIPYLQVQASPISSPRVGQDVAFSMLCSPKVVCSERPDGFHIETPRIDVGGVVMHAELVHLRVLPAGEGQPDTVDCAFAGLAVEADELDAAKTNDPRICRYTYDRSSNGAGAGTRGDRYAANVSAYWRVFVDDGTGPRPFASAYKKSSTHLIRVTEVQTLVVS
ncbi:MAG: hypothetical protein H7323_01810 [Frankiales bacterium]|nr:hypothetical protein [Frankiales bacterium]